MNPIDTLALNGMAFVGLDLGGLSQFLFFQTINDFLRDEIDIFQWQLLQRTALLVGSLSLLLLTLWIMLQGFLIVTGRSREPMMALAGDSLKAILIISLATGTASASSQLYWAMTDGTANLITRVVTGDSGSPFKDIDRSLAYMQATFTVIDSLSAGGDDAQESAKSRAMWFTGIGLAGPGVIAGSMLLLNKIAIAIFVGLGPLFILALMFNQTKSLFSRWLYYGVGTLFSLGVLSFTIALSLKMVQAVAASFLARYAAAKFLDLGEGMNGINSMALQQGGLGLVLSILIVSAPPIAASFFQGMLATFSVYSSFGNVGAKDGQVPPGVMRNNRPAEPTPDRAPSRSDNPNPGFPANISHSPLNNKANNDEIGIK